MAEKTVKKHHATTQQFTYKAEAGEITLPFIENLPMGLLEDAFSVPASEVTAFILDKLMGEGGRELRRNMTLGEFQEMVKLWNEESAISLQDF